VRSFLAGLANRAYCDFLMPSRLDAYERLLGIAIDAGYEIVGVERFWSQVQVEPRVPEQDPARRRLVLRHDVDTDPGTAAAMWRIERRLGVRSSYYFRLSTLDVSLARGIAEDGGEAGYHYEELATLAKRRGLRDADRVLALLPEARKLFARNLARLRALTGLPIVTAASHGDFANRVLDLPNWLLLADMEFRESVGIAVETYDEALTRHLSRRYSDTLRPRHWVPESPVPALRDREAAIQLLVHPRHWRANRRANARDDLERLRDGVAYRLDRGRGAGASAE